MINVKCSGQGPALPRVAVIKVAPQVSGRASSSPRHFVKIYRSPRAFRKAYWQWRNELDFCGVAH